MAYRTTDGRYYEWFIPAANKRRQERMKKAKEKGRHSKEEWYEMLVFFNHRCCKCFKSKDNVFIVKDHVVSISEGGSDGIDNLQPLCWTCNTNKSSDSKDYRNLLAEHLKKRLPSLYSLPKKETENA